MTDEPEPQDAQPAVSAADGYCPQCGSPRRAGAAFCSNCGTPLPARGEDSGGVQSAAPGGDAQTGYQPPPPQGYVPASPGYQPLPPPGYQPPPPPGYGYGYGYQSAPLQQRTNGFSIASLVLGIVWIYWIGSVLALVFGYIAKNQIDQSNGTQSGRGMAIAGIVLGWIGVATLVLVIFLAAVGAASSPTP